VTPGIPIVTGDLPPGIKEIFSGNGVNLGGDFLEQ
jgi:hypothetical protein